MTIVDDDEAILTLYSKFDITLTISSNVVGSLDHRESDANICFAFMALL